LRSIVILSGVQAIIIRTKKRPPGGGLAESLRDGRSGRHGGTFNDFTGEREALAAAWTAAERGIGRTGAGRTVANSLTDIGLTNRITNANDHRTPLLRIILYICCD